MVESTSRPARLDVALVALALSFAVGACAPESDAAPAMDGGVGAGGAGGHHEDASHPAASGPVPPTLRAGRYVFDVGDVSLEIDPAHGGRITALKLGGASVLTSPEANPESWGSTFWTSPQSWGWPPPPEIDAKPYAASATTSELVLTGGVSPAVGVSVTKTFSARYETGAVTITYGITNGRSVPVQVAPWEVSRVAAGGLTFFATSTRLAADDRPHELAVSESAGVTFFDDDPRNARVDSELVADAAEGWIAHAVGGLLLIKKFPDVPSTRLAPGEGDVGIYADAARTYVALETQGAYVSIPPLASIKWTTTWWLKRLPPDVMARPGNAALVKLVRDTVL